MHVTISMYAITAVPPHVQTLCLLHHRLLLLLPCRFSDSTPDELRDMQTRLSLHAHASRMHARQKFLGLPPLPPPVDPPAASAFAIEAGRYPLPFIKCAVVTGTTVTFYGLASAGVPVPPPLPPGAMLRGRALEAAATAVALQ